MPVPGGSSASFLLKMEPPQQRLTSRGLSGTATVIPASSSSTVLPKGGSVAAPTPSTVQPTGTSRSAAAGRTLRTGTSRSVATGSPAAVRETAGTSRSAATVPPAAVVREPITERRLLRRLQSAPAGTGGTVDGVGDGGLRPRTRAASGVLHESRVSVFPHREGYADVQRALSGSRRAPQERQQHSAPTVQPGAEQPLRTAAPVPLQNIPAQSVHPEGQRKRDASSELEAALRVASSALEKHLEVTRHTTGAAAPASQPLDLHRMQTEIQRLTAENMELRTTSQTMPRAGSVLTDALRVSPIRPLGSQSLPANVQRPQQQQQQQQQQPPPSPPPEPRAPSPPAPKREVRTPVTEPPPQRRQTPAHPDEPPSPPSAPPASVSEAMKRSVLEPAGTAPAKGPSAAQRTPGVAAGTRERSVRAGVHSQPTAAAPVREYVIPQASDAATAMRSASPGSVDTDVTYAVPLSRIAAPVLSHPAPLPKQETAASHYPIDQPEAPAVAAALHRSPERFPATPGWFDRVREPAQSLGVHMPTVPDALLEASPVAAWAPFESSNRPPPDHPGMVRRIVHDDGRGFGIRYRAEGPVVYITSIVPGSAAAQAEIPDSGRLVSIGGLFINHPDDLAAAGEVLRQHTAAEVVVDVSDTAPPESDASSSIPATEVPQHQQQVADSGIVAEDARRVRVIGDTAELCAAVTSHPGLTCGTAGETASYARLAGRVGVVLEEDLEEGTVRVGFPSGNVQAWLPINVLVDVAPTGTAPLLSGRLSPARLRGLEPEAIESSGPPVRYHASLGRDVAPDALGSLSDRFRRLPINDYAETSAATQSIVTVAAQVVRAQARGDPLERIGEREGWSPKRKRPVSPLPEELAQFVSSLEMQPYDEGPNLDPEKDFVISGDPRFLPTRVGFSFPGVREDAMGLARAGGAWQEVDSEEEEEEEDTETWSQAMLPPGSPAEYGFDPRTDGVYLRDADSIPRRFLGEDEIARYPPASFPKQPGITTKFGGLPGTPTGSETNSNYTEDLEQFVRDMDQFYDQAGPAEYTRHLADLLARGTCPDELVDAYESQLDLLGKGEDPRAVRPLEGLGLGKKRKKKKKKRKKDRSDKEKKDRKKKDKKEKRQSSLAPQLSVASLRPIPVETQVTGLSAAVPPRAASTASLKRPASSASLAVPSGQGGVSGPPSSAAIAPQSSAATPAESAKPEEPDAEELAYQKELETFQKEMDDFFESAGRDKYRDYVQELLSTDAVPPELKSVFEEQARRMEKGLDPREEKKKPAGKKPGGKGKKVRAKRAKAAKEEGAPAAEGTTAAEGTPAESKE
eukprot:TRINITY_DN2898_c4_g1_i1.p1 TRINITY_DN2898_c4_g1~~TRINITY_DN2898_c4_g1_i1.p1  ORF type:complete len:1312 (+),score=76.09 TRINITY_DN2898_c4_g1_i1:79-4014(+)